MSKTAERRMNSKGGDPRVAAAVPATVAVPPSKASDMVSTLNAMTQATLMFWAAYKHFHWTVAGPYFAPLHTLYDAHAGTIYLHVDDLAERVIQLGGIPMALPADVAANSLLRAPDAAVISSTAQLAWLDKAHVTMITRLSEAISSTTEPGVADLLTRILQDHHKMAWMVRASAHGA